MPGAPSYEGVERGTKKLKQAPIERRRKEKALPARGGSTYPVAEDMPALFCRFLPDGTLTFVSESYCSYFNKKCEELIGQNFFQFIPQEDQGRVRNKFISLTKENPIITYDHKVIAPDGTIRWHQWTDCALLDRNGMVAEYQSLGRDITEQKETEEAYRALVEQSLQGLVIMQGFRIVFANQAFAEIAGSTVEELLSFSPEEVRALVHPDDQDLVWGRFQARLGGKQVPPRYEYRGIRKDGTVCWLEMIASLIDYGGKPAIRGAVVDITDHKRAEEALRQSKERFKELAELLPETIYEMDLKGNLTFVNRNAFTHFGYTQQDFDRGLNAHDMIAPPDRQRSMANVKRIFKGEELGLNEYTALRKDGSTFPCMIRSTAIMREGTPVGLRGFIIDMTERKKAEEERKKLEAQLQYTQRMEALGTLAGGIAHNFNNLLAGIMGNLSLTLLDSHPTQPHFDHLKRIEKLVKSGSQLTSQLLGYARGGRYDVKLLDFNRLVTEIFDTFGAAKKEIRVHRSLAEDLLGIKADQGQIEQVLLNVLVNAGDAMPGGGDLFLETMNVTDKDMGRKPYKVRPGTYVLLKVKDTGTGMDKKTLQHIFEPFFTTKGLGAGTGLGLASAYGIIKAHQGYIDVESEKGHGTTFEIYLPASESKSPEASKRAGHPAEGSETILLVDDEPMILEVAVEVLRELGYTALEAQGGRQAVELYNKKRAAIDLVILDMIMPDMGGGETYDRIKQINPQVKVLLSSGYSIDGEATEILERGCQGFIQKPFGMEELSMKIREILDGK
ncbi:MAG: PAS domain S-box protein [Deltaproteobacteria bacterium]|nr:MAG: PAS domain S-box protein [Deltaproteobacteria bacterium]